MKIDESLKILFCTSHPAHVHLFKNCIKELQARGHETLVAARDRGITTNLLESYGLKYKIIWKNSESLMETFLEYISHEKNLLYTVYEFNPDIIVSRFSPAAAHISTICNIPNVVFEDTKKESSVLRKTVYPLSDVILTPSSFPQNINANQIFYEGFHELAYLHPSWFDPDPKILSERGIDPEEAYYVLRFVEWGAHHDHGEHGFSLSEKRDIVSLLSEHGQVYITSETELPPDLSRYQLPIKPEHIHHLLYYADLFVGDSQTMTCEAGVLGTPAIRSNSLSEPRSEHAMYLNELEEEYNLVYSTPDKKKAFNKIEQIINEGSSDTWEKRRKMLLVDKIDTTEFMIKTILRVNQS